MDGDEYDVITRECRGTYTTESWIESLAGIIIWGQCVYVGSCCNVHLMMAAHTYASAAATATEREGAWVDILWGHMVNMRHFRRLPSVGSVLC